MHTKIGQTSWTKEQIINSIPDFLRFYDTRPIKDNTGGGLSVNMIDAWFIFNQIKPKYVIESGVWFGQGTWMIEQVLPNTKIFCIDPSQSQIRYTSKNAKYTTMDFLALTNDNISKDKAKDTMIYFDDHQDQYKRVIHAYSMGFKHILLDDNYPSYKGRRHLSIEACLSNKADAGYNIPKDAKSNLMDIIKVYHACNPVFKWNEPVSMEMDMIEEAALHDEIIKEYETLYKDMHNYRWTTYIELK